MKPPVFDAFGRGLTPRGGGSDTVGRRATREWVG